MKKILLAIMAVFVFTVSSSAQDKIEIKDVKIPEKGSANLEVNLISEQHSYIAFQFDLKLPAGISARASASNLTERATSVSEGWSVAFKQIDADNNIYNCIAYNSDNAAISGTSGTVLNIVLTAADNETLVQGYTGVGTITGAIMSTKEQKYQSAEGEFNIEIVEDRVIFKETDTELPLYTAGQKKNVRMTRTIKAGSWSTIVLPFTLTKAKAEAAFGTDVKLAEFTGFDTEYADEEDVTPDAITLKFTTYTMSSKKGMTGGKPFLIQTTADVASFESDEVTMVDAVADVTMADEYETSGKFTGSLVKTIVPADGLFINSNKFYYSVGQTNIKAFRGWFELGAILDKETDFGAKVTFTVDGDATDIDGVPSFQRVVEGVYDLSGRKIQLQDGNLNKLQKGVYIIDGKKVTIK